MNAIAKEIYSKINAISMYRTLNDYGMQLDHFDFPTNQEEEQELVTKMIHTALRYLYPGCKVRSNTLSFTLRLDGHRQRLAYKVNALMQDTNNRRWLETNHRNLYSIYSSNNYQLRDTGMYRVNEMDGKFYLIVPFKMNRVNQYYHYGVDRLFNELHYLSEKMKNLAEAADEIIRLVNAEIERKEQERLARLQKEKEDLMIDIRRRVSQSAYELEESESPIDREVSKRIVAWARENAVEPLIMKELSIDNILANGQKVRIISEIGSEEENWFVVPPFEDGFEIPEGYELLDGYGHITAIDQNHERSRNGVAPVIVEEHIFCSFNVDHWKHLIGEDYEQLREVTAKIYSEVEEELMPQLEEERRELERLQKEAEEQAAREAEIERERAEREARERAEREARERAEREAREREERERAEQEARERAEREAEEARQREEEVRRQQERAEALAAQLRAQLEQNGGPQEVEYTPPQVVPSDERETATSPGIYRDSRAIPLEQYVAISTAGATRRFSDIDSAADWRAYEPGEITIYDYHAPHDVVDTYYYE